MKKWHKPKPIVASLKICHCCAVSIVRNQGPGVGSSLEYWQGITLRNRNYNVTFSACSTVSHLGSFYLLRFFFHSDKSPSFLYYVQNLSIYVLADVCPQYCISRFCHHFMLCRDGIGTPTSALRNQLSAPLGYLYV